MNIFKVDGKRNIGLLFMSILVAESIGALNIFLGVKGRLVYESLKKPLFTPPTLVVPIVWVILFLLMAVAIYRVWIRGKSGQNVRKALTLYLFQLGLNLLWAALFFRWTLYGLAFIEALLLMVFILITTFELFKKDKLAGIMMIPYILWVSFAGVINYVIWMLNEAV